MKIMNTIKSYRGPMATVVACPHCKMTVRVPKSRPGFNVGRGYGLREINKARKQVYDHIIATHQKETTL